MNLSPNQDLSGRPMPRPFARIVARTPPVMPPKSILACAAPPLRLPCVSMVMMSPSRVALWPSDQSTAAAAGKDATAAAATKDDAKQAVADITKLGLTTVMLTGDARKEANAVAKEAGITEVRAELLPQDKLKEMNDLRNKYGGVMFVGDGINDAPVLAGADVGAAMGSGADAAIEAADVVFMNSEMSAIPKAIAIAVAVNRVAWQNVVFALIVKVIIMVAGLFGYASMWAAVFADTGVSVLCVLNACRVLYKKF